MWAEAHTSLAAAFFLIHIFCIHPRKSFILLCVPLWRLGKIRFTNYEIFQARMAGEGDNETRLLHAKGYVVLFMVETVS